MDRPASLEEGEIIDLTGVDDRDDDQHARPPTRNINTVSRSAVTTRDPANQRQRAPAPSDSPVRRQQRRRSSRSRSRSPIAGKTAAQNGVEHRAQAGHVTVPLAIQQQLEGTESGQEEGQYALTPTEIRIRKTAKLEAESQQSVEKIAFESPSGYNPIVDKLLSAGKLCLVLDLDHTLFHSVMFSELDPSVNAWLQARAEADAAIPHQEKRMLFRIDGMQMYTKLRPGVREFLRKTAEKFELWIHTNGNVAYASAVIPFLDPTGSLFSGRIIAQGADRPEEMRPDQPKALIHGLEARESISIVVDDTFAVWQAHKNSLIMVERYLYFPSNRLPLKGTSLLENKRDEDMTTGMLMIILQLLEKVHEDVFKSLKNVSSPSKTSKKTAKSASGGQIDVRQVLATHRKNVLKGVNIVFSRIIPLEQDPKTHELWKMAEAFGANCSALMQKGKTTHLVAGDGGTEKVSAARAQKIAVVSPMWLKGSCLLWKKLDEKQYAVPR